MTAQHTPEPWKAFGDGDDSYIDGVMNYHSGEGGAYLIDGSDVRRIVACVNACAALSTPVLQQAVFTDMTVDYVLKCAEAKKQNAELLAVMEKAAKHIEENGLVSNCKYASGWLREAIAKAGAL